MPSLLSSLGKQPCDESRDMSKQKTDAFLGVRRATTPPIVYLPVSMTGLNESSHMETAAL